MQRLSRNYTTDKLDIKQKDKLDIKQNGRPVRGSVTKQRLVIPRCSTNELKNSFVPRTILSPTHASRAPTMQRAVATRHFGGAHNRIRDRADWCKVFHLSVFIFVLSVLFCCNYAHASMAMPSCLLTI